MGRCTVSPRLSFKLQQLRSHLVGPGTDRLAAEELALSVLEGVTASVGQLSGQTSGTGRAETLRAHRKIAESVRLLLAETFRRPLSLVEIARQIRVSPYHLSRVFRIHTGVPLHRYRVFLRLRAALERLADGEDDLTRLALDLGFSSHSHFTDVFRRVFAIPPSAARHKLRMLRKSGLGR